MRNIAKFWALTSLSIVSFGKAHADAPLGGYVGVTVGYQQNMIKDNKSFNFGDATPTYTTLPATNPALPYAFPVANVKQLQDIAAAALKGDYNIEKINKGGAELGMHFGYNCDVGNDMVVGGDLSLSYTTLNADKEAGSVVIANADLAAAATKLAGAVAQYANLFANNNTGKTVVTGKVNYKKNFSAWLAVKVGTTFGNGDYLAYIKAGPEFSNFKTTVTRKLGAVDTAPAATWGADVSKSSSNVVVGGRFGLGVTSKLDSNWAVSFEASYGFSPKKDLKPKSDAFGATINISYFM